MINLLNLVLPAIRPLVDCQDFEYRKALKDAVNEFGVVEVVYSAWKKCNGSVQPMESSMMQMLDLDKSKRAILVWGSIKLNTMDIQDHPDQVRHNGRIFNCVQCTDWMMANGWHATACTEDKGTRKDWA